MYVYCCFSFFILDPNLGGDCGLMVKTFHSHTNNHEKQHIVLEYACTNPQAGRNMTLIDDSYYTVFGMLCGLCEYSAYLN